METKASQYCGYPPNIVIPKNWEQMMEKDANQP
jgi:hypothetical protein